MSTVSSSRLLYCLLVCSVNKDGKSATGFETDIQILTCYPYYWPIVFKFWFSDSTANAVVIISTVICWHKLWYCTNILHAQLKDFCTNLILILYIGILAEKMTNLKKNRGTHDRVIYVYLEFTDFKVYCWTFLSCYVRVIYHLQLILKLFIGNW